MVQFLGPLPATVLSHIRIGKTHKAGMRAQHIVPESLGLRERKIKGKQDLILRGDQTVINTGTPHALDPEAIEINTRRW